MKIFITGLFRSGTTLLAQIIKQSKEISLALDMVHFMRFGYQRYGRDRIFLKNALKLGEDFDKRLKMRFKQSFDLKKYKQKVKSLDQITYADLYDIIMTLFVGNANWGEKCLLEWRNAVDLISIFDDMFVVHIIRDPRDVIVSWKRLTNAPGKDYLDVIGNCYDSMNYAQTNAKKHPTRYYVIKYEDLLTNPEQQVKRLCKFLGWKFDQAMLNTVAFKDRIKKDVQWQANTSFHNDKLKGISTKPIGRWREHATRVEIFLCEMILGEIMAVYKYKKSDINWDFKDVHNAMAELQQSPLAYQGILNIIRNNEGVQRFPADPLDSANWCK